MNVGALRALLASTTGAARRTFPSKPKRTLGYEAWPEYGGRQCDNSSLA